MPHLIWNKVGQRGPGIPAGKDQFDETRGYDHRDDVMKKTHATSSICRPTLKPGPSADIR